jgi:O-methyltransferase
MDDVAVLLKKYPIISDQVDVAELTMVLQQAAKSQPGAIVEFGCYIGTTSLFLRRLLGDREFHVYDSFEGLPEKTSPDLSPAGEQFKKGELTATKKQFIQEFKKANLPLPVIHKGWFDQVQPDDIPDGISFAFLDGDYYESVKVPLHLIEPKLLPGAIIVVDDYANEALPGAAKAVDEWCRTRGYTVRVAHSLAIIHV